MFGAAKPFGGDNTDFAKQDTSKKEVKPDEAAKAYTVKDEGTYPTILVVEGMKLYVIGEVL